MLDLIVFIVLLTALAIVGALTLMPIAAWLPLLLTACGVFYVRRNAIEQARLAERKMGLDLLPRRIEWLDTLQKAFHGRMTEQREEIDELVNGRRPSTQGVHLTNLFLAQSSAKWLFGKSMANLVGKLLEELGVLGQNQLEARQGDAKYAFEAVDQMGACFIAWSAIVDHAKPFIDVSEIRLASRDKQRTKWLKLPRHRDRSALPPT